jgi:hypothetical protein
VSDLNDLARDLSALGAETESTRAVKRVLPWVVSLAVHAGLVALGFVLTWTVVLIQRDEEPTLIVADFDAMTYDPLATLAVEQMEVDQEMVQDRRPTETMDRLDEVLDVEVDPIRLFSGEPAEAALARFAPDPRRAKASFVGLSATNARRIVYVIDASGSMIRWLPIVVEELARSLDGLVPQQRFSVVFFSGNEAIAVPPAGRLISATEEEKVRVLTWIDRSIIPAGRSNPLAAIEAALGLEPDVIFLLSENITGSGEFEIDQVDLLALLDRLNPRDAATGRRVTRINCVQFLDPDPLETLLKIAREHGGPNGYKFLDERELGLKAP